jgi:hypothetical protein
MSLPEDPRRAYATDDPVEDERRAAKHHLVKETKRVVEDVALLDVGATDPSEVDELAALTCALANRLEQAPSLRALGGPAVAGTADAALLERSPVSGRSNPLAPPLHLEMHEGLTTGWAVYGDAYEGPPGCLHGGFVAAAFDDLMGFAQMASGKVGFTGTLTVKMLRPTPLNERIDYEAGLERVEGRKIWCWATARHGDELLAEAEIVFISPREWPQGLPHP